MNMTSIFIISTIDYSQEESEVYVISGENNFRHYMFKYTLEEFFKLEEDEYKDLNYLSSNIETVLHKLFILTKQHKLLCHTLGIKDESIRDIIDSMINISYLLLRQNKYIPIWYNVVIVHGDNLKVTNCNRNKTQK